MYSDGSGHATEWWQWALSSLTLLAVIACCMFVPGGQVFGVGSVVGGCICEALGGTFEFGASIGGIVGSIAGGFIYRGIMSYRFSKMTIYQKGTYAEKYVQALYGEKAFKPTTGTMKPDLLFRDGTTIIEVENVAYQTMTKQLKGYLTMGHSKNILYVRVGTKISSALKSSSYVIKYLPL